MFDIIECCIWSPYQGFGEPVVEWRGDVWTETSTEGHRDHGPKTVPGWSDQGIWGPTWCETQAGQWDWGLQKIARVRGRQVSLTS